MDRIFSYLDYRLFLKDRFSSFKKARRGVTHRSLSQKAGFASPNFLKLVMEGERNLTEQSIPKVSKAFDLEGREAVFFESLVQFNQAKDVDRKDLAYDRLKSLRRDLPLQRVEHSQFDYFDRWYAVAIRELVETKGFREDPEWISAKLERRVTPAQVRNTLALLTRLQLLERTAEGRLKATQPILSTGDEVSSLAVHRFHQAMIEKAIEALRKTPAPYRDLSSLTLAVSKETFQRIKVRLKEFRKEILALANSQNGADVVYQLNLQFFNLSEIVWDESSKSSA